jgi:hypothetical protein
MRIARFEIFKFAGGDKQRRDQWRELSEQCQQISNRVWQLFERWHDENNSVPTIKQFLNDLAAWREAKGGKDTKPKLTVQAVNAELSAKIYRDVSDNWPRINARTRVVLLNRLTGGIRTRKAATGSLSGWINVLFCREGRPSFTRPVPIPFDKENSKLVPPEKPTDNWRLGVWVERDTTDGHSLRDECELMTRKRKAWGQAAILQKIADGRAKFCGSMLSYDRGKWYAMVCYDEPRESHAGLDATKKAVLLPGRTVAWLVKTGRGTRRRYAGRDGVAKHVIGMRRILFNERQERQENYRWASSALKGHGRAKAIAGWEKLSSRWRDFVKRYNNEITTKLVAECVADGIGTIEYWQPTGFQRDRRWLTGTDYRCGWDYFQVATMLAQKCERAGIEFVLRKIGCERRDVGMRAS